MKAYRHSNILSILFIKHILLSVCFRRCQWLLFAFIFIVQAIGLCQADGVQIQIYGFEDGLSHRNVFKIQQDPKGFIWLATFNGLNRFDGVNFEYFDLPQTTNPFLSDLTIDTLGNLYTIEKSKIHIFHPDKSKHKVAYQDNNELKLLPQNLYLDLSQNLWFTTFSNQMGKSWLHQTRKKNYRLEQNHSSPNSPIAGGGTFIYIVTKAGIQKLDKQGNLVKTYLLSNTNPITDLFVDTQQNVWVLEENGNVFFLQDDTFVKHPVSTMLSQKSQKLQTLFVEPNGDIWLGGFSQLWHYNAFSQKLNQYNNRIRQVTKNAVQYRDFFQDWQGVIWVASDFGAIKINRTNQLFRKYMHQGSEYCDHGICSMRGITGDGKKRVFFSYYNAIHQLDEETDVITPLFQNMPFHNPPFGILYHNDNLYLGNGRRIDLQTMQIDTLFKAKKTDKGVLCVDNSNHLWVGFENQIYIFDTAHQLISPPWLPLLNNAIQSDISYIFQGKFNQDIWIGTTANGLIRFSKNTNEISFYNTANSSLQSNRILAMYEDTHQVLWVATANGLHILQLQTNTITHKTVEDGLSNNFINGLLSEGDSCIWLSTDNGLSRYSVASDKFTNYYQQDGLSSNEFNRISFYQSADGRMYFGGLNGVNAFYPSEQFIKKKEAATAPLLFTSFARYNGRSDSLITQKSNLRSDSTIVLSAQDKFFTIEFSLADYSNPSQNKYSYMLEGFEPNWSKPSSSNVARFYRIPAGKYTLKVRASSIAENWHPNILEIPITIKEPFYNSWRFLISAFFFGTALAFILFRWRIYRIEMSRKKLEEEVQERTKELAQEKEKSDALLLNILPAQTAYELKQYGKAKAKRFEEVSVFFSDFKGFTKIASQMEPEQLVDEIDHCFRAFDEIIETYGLEKIKTIGDAYMCVGGIPNNKKNMAIDVVKAALEIQAYMAALCYEKKEAQQPYFEARIGIHTGPVVAGVVGIKKFAYDIWGDTVNIASRMEENGTIGKVNISAATYALIKEHFNCTPRGEIQVKNKGVVEMYFVDSLKMKET